MDDGGKNPGARPGWVDDPAEPPAGHGEDGWPPAGGPPRGHARMPRHSHQPLPGKHAEDGLWEHVLMSGGAVVLATWIASVAMPHAWPLWMILLTGATISMAVWYTAISLTDSFPMASYLATWGFVLTAWLAVARVVGPWKGEIIFSLVLPVLVLMPMGVTVIRRYRDRVSRAADTGRDTMRLRECRYWEGLLQRLGTANVVVRDVMKTDNGRQLYCRLGKAADGRSISSMPDADTARRICVQRRLRPGSIYIEEAPQGGSAADFIVHINEQAGPRLTRWLPAENSILSVNDKFPLGVLDTGKQWALKLREVVVFICGVRGSGKALDVDTRIATPSGWTTMGEILVGDQVFDETGQPCRVIAATDVMRGRPCYEVEFSDGTVIIADRDHQWLVDTDASRRSARRKAVFASRPDGRKSRGQDHLRKWPEVLTTRQMIPGLRMLNRSGVTAGGGVSNYSVCVAGALQCPDADLPVPPYVLGAWLGDGHSAGSRITTADPEILAAIEAEGETVWIVPSTVKGAAKRETVACALASASCSPSGKVTARQLCVNHYAIERRAGRLDQWPLLARDTERREPLAAYTIGALQPRLRHLGVLGNKHIPVSYLRASEAQRRALLAGLLDTDGTCTETGTAEFSNTNGQLARDAYHLVCSLGYKATLRSKAARCNGKDCGVSWTVAFTPADKVFRLQRKLARQVTRVRSASAQRYVTAIRHVPSRPVRCIQVDSPNQLYLAGESCVPTHNSTLLNVFLAQLCRMPDAVIFMIDLKGGQEARMWLMPWILGLTDRPAIDWLATTREEAKVMLDALWRAGTARAESGRYGRKLRPSKAAPAVIVICDETAVLTGHMVREDGLSAHQLSTRLLQIAETFRSVAIDPVVSAVRAVVDVTGNSGFKAMAEVRIGMRVATTQEGQAIFPDDYPAAQQLAQLKDRGMFIPKVGADLHPPVHGFNITDGEPDDDGHPTEDRITPIVLATAARRPAPEQLVIDAMGEAYAKRWEGEHIKQLIETWRAEAGLHDDPRPQPGRVPGVPEDEQGAWEEIVGQLDGVFGDAEPAFDDGDPRRKLHPARKRLYEILITRKSAGEKVDRLWHQLQREGHDITRQTVHDWLNQAEKQGCIIRSGKARSPHARWIWHMGLGDEYGIPGWD
jgi:LAGLIDADG-like domain